MYDECRLSEGGGVREQAAVVITYWDDGVPWVGEKLGGLGCGRGMVALLDKLLLLEFLVVKTGIAYRRVG